MLITFHIIIALLSLAYTTYVYLSPSQVKLNSIYGFIATTLLSGVALVATSPASIVLACLSGIIYLGVVLFGTALVRRKLSTQS